jgi:hypothetical protein
MSVFDEQTFYSDVMEYYNNNTDVESYDMSIVFDWYFELHIYNTETYNQWFYYFFPDHEETDENLIYNKLLKIVLDNLEADVLSEQDTDDDD